MALHQTEKESYLRSSLGHLSYLMIPNKNRLSQGRFFGELMLCSDYTTTQA